MSAWSTDAVTSLRAVASALPDGVVTNEDLAREHPEWNIPAVTKKTGVLERRVSADGETAFDLSVRACEALLERSEVDFGRVDAIVYCTQTPDYLLPGNSHLLQKALGLSDDVIAFDYALGCSGYVYGMGIVDSFIKSGLASEVLLVTAETYTKRINRKDRSMRVLFGDGAAVTHLCATDSSAPGRILGAKLCSRGRDYERTYIPAGGARAPHSRATAVESVDRNGNVHSPDNLFMNGASVWAFVSSAVPPHVEDFLGSHSLSVDDIDLWVFHQASAMTLDSLVKALRIPQSKMFCHMERTGNLSSASIPVALEAAMESGAIQPGAKVVLCGFGGGLSYGSVLLQF